MATLYDVSFIIATDVVVGLAGEGNEGAVYGLVTTVSNLSQPFALTITKSVDAGFDITNDDIVAETHHVRMQVTYALRDQLARAAVAAAAASAEGADPGPQAYQWQEQVDGHLHRVLHRVCSRLVGHGQHPVDRQEHLVGGKGCKKKKDKYVVPATTSDDAVVPF